MDLSISNIAWNPENDATVYGLMRKHGFSGLEIAPTRIFPENPYDRLFYAIEWSRGLRADYGFSIPSIQSIWYGKQEKLFGTEEERQALLEYTKKAIDFAEAISCSNLVFGCPRNRFMPEGTDPEIALMFFKIIGDYAYAHGTSIGMEANPPIYNTNYVNDTQTALKLIKSVDSKGFRLNLDIGTMLYNHEAISVLTGNVKYISHIHISEPSLKPIEKRELHKQLRDVLKEEDYKGFVSIEMGKTDSIDTIDRIMDYVKEVLG